MKFQRLYALTGMLLLSVSALVLTKTTQSPMSDRGDDVPVLNKTSGFQVVQARHVKNELRLSLKNTYAQRITAFAFTVGKGFRITEDFVTSEVSDEVGIQPQQTFERTYPLPSNKPTEAITLEAVVLSDKTGDGDGIIFEDIRDTRLGQAVQIKRSLRVLAKFIDARTGVEKLESEMRSALDRPETETLNALRQIRAAGAMNRKTGDSISDVVKEGLAAGRADILRRIAEAKLSPHSKDSLLATKVYYEKLLNRL